MMGFKIGYEGCVNFISEGICGTYFWKGSNCEASTLKNKGRLCVYRQIVWYHFQNHICPRLLKDSFELKHDIFLLKFYATIGFL